MILFDTADFWGMSFLALGCYSDVWKTQPGFELARKVPVSKELSLHLFFSKSKGLCREYTSSCANISHIRLLFYS